MYTIKLYYTLNIFDRTLSLVGDALAYKLDDIYNELHIQ